MSRSTVMNLMVGCALTGGLSVFGATAARAQPVRGVYVHAGAGASFNQGQQIRPHPRAFQEKEKFTRGKELYHPGYMGLTSVGYGLGNGFRVEAEGNYRDNRLSHIKGAAFKNRGGGHQQVYGGMANALFDMDIGQNWIYPYFGAGIGYGWQKMNSRVRPRGAASNGYSEQIKGTPGGFAYQAMFGLSLPVPWVVGLSTTMEYRFYALAGRHSHNGTAYGSTTCDLYCGGPRGVTTQTIGYGDTTNGKIKTSTYFNHSLILGLRYEFNPAPPPPAAQPVAIHVPAPAPQRTYLVFFGWNSASLSPRAREIIGQAAQESTRVRTTRLQVNGYTDTSHAGTAEQGASYNMKLSLKRAEVVKAELIHNGIPAAEIDVRGFGDSHLLVPSGSNTRESQNRRVEIIPD